MDGLKKNGQVAILVMDSQNVGNKNPFNINIVKKKIKSALKKYENRYVIIKIPVVSEVLYGRKAWDINLEK